MGMRAFLRLSSGIYPILIKSASIFLFFIIILSNIVPHPNPTSNQVNASKNNETEANLSSGSIRSIPRNNALLGFTEHSTGLPSSGDYNYVTFGDFNNDSEIDIAFGGEDWDVQNTVGLYAYTGNGGTSWSKSSSGLWSTNSWGGLAMADADEDGYVELYATDEDWGTDSNAGIKVWEFINNTWSDSTENVSTPLSSGRPCNVILTNVTGDSKLDMVICRYYGVKYYENTGGNPVTWSDKSSGLPTSSWYTTAAVDDVNKDGLKDIVCCMNDREYLYIQHTTGTTWQKPSTGISAPGYMTGVVIADVNDDSHMDIIFGTCTPSNGYGIRILLGNSGGTDGKSFVWTDGNTGLPTIERYGQIQVVDIDLDGDLDIVAPCATSDYGMKIYLGNGTTNPGMNIGWTLAKNTNLTNNGNWYCANCADINGDGSLDILGASWGTGIKVWLNNLSRDMIPPAQVTNLTIVNVATNSITVNWTAPADNGTNASSGPVQSYDLRYSSSLNVLKAWLSATKCTALPTPAAPGENETFKITELSPGTKYYIALKSADEQPNYSPMSNIVSNITLGFIDTTLPGQITDLQVKNPTNQSLNLTWSAPADNGSDASSGAVVEYEIRYNLTAQITSGSWDKSTKIMAFITPGTPGTLEEFNVSGLQPETKYYFAIKARDERPNWGSVSNSAIGTTLPDPDITPPASVNDLLAIDPTDTTINLTWTATGDDGASGNASYYDIRYATSSITAATWVAAKQCENEPAPQSFGNIEHFQITYLLPKTKYYFALKIGDEIPFWSDLSNIASNTTLTSLDDIAPGEINDLTATQPTSTNVTLRWTAPGDDGYSGTVSGYEIRYNTEQITSALWSISNLCPDFPVPVQLGAKQTYVVTGLLSSTTYYFAVKAYDERPNYSPLSNIANATTIFSKDDIAPAAITDLSASAVSENSIKLTWSAPGDDGKSGTATGYDIRYATSKITDELWFEATKCYNSPRPQSAGTTESFKISSLFAGTKYYFAIRSFDERPNYSKLSNIPDATTYASEDDVPPNRITDLVVVETTQKTATLTWTAPGDDGNSGTATVYNIRYSTVPITAANWNNMQKIKETPAPKTAGEKETIIITGLTEATSYYFAIKAADERPNWSPVSNSPNGITSGTSKPELLVTLIPEKTIIYSGESTNLSIEVLSSEQFQPVAAVEVNIISDNPGMIITPVVGYTDERGTFEVSITTPSVRIITIAIISVEVIKPGYEYNKTELELTIQPPQIIPRFDLRIQKQDITFNQNIINDSDDIKIMVNIINLGPYDAIEFIVKFYIDNITIGNEIHINELKINEYLQLKTNWTATFGEHNIRIEIIPMDYDMELNFTDNIAQRNFIVKGKESSEKTNEDEPNQNSYFYIWSLISIIIIVFIFIMVLLFIIGKRQYDSYTYDNFIMPKEGIDENLPDEPLVSDDQTEDKPEANPEETIENDNDITESTETETKLDFEAETLETLEDTPEDPEDTSTEEFIIYE